MEKSTSTLKVTLDAELYHCFKERSEELGVSMSEIMRTLVADFVGKERKVKISYEIY